MANKKIRISNGKKVAMGAGIAAAGLATYMLLGPKGKKNRKNVKNWARNMEKDIVKNIEKVKDLSGPAYEKIIDQAREKYEKVKSIDADEMAMILSNLRKHWSAIAKKHKIVKSPAKRNGTKKAKSSK